MASAVAFVLDRFMYWYGGAKVILNVVSQLEACDQSPAIAPQMLIRKARVLKDSGDLHGAVRVLHAIMASDWNSTGNAYSSPQRLFAEGFLNFAIFVFNEILTWPADSIISICTAYLNVNV